MSRFAFSSGLISSSLTALALLAAPNALAKPSAACMNSYEKAQEHKKAGRMQKAREAMTTCAQDSCGSFIRRECAGWLEQLVSEMPSVVFDVNDKGGAPVADIEISVDGTKIADRLDGRAVSIDPGKHTFVFRTRDGIEIKQEVVIEPGQQNRKLSLIIAAADKEEARPTPSKAEVSNATKATKATKEKSEKSKPAKTKAAKVESDESASPKAEEKATEAASDSSEPSSSEQADSEQKPEASEAAPPADNEDLEAKRRSERTLSFILGGVGVAGIAGFGVLGLIAKDEHEALPRCYPNCTESDVTRVKTMYTVANVSLGVGIASLGAATYFYIKSRSGEQQTAKSLPAKKRYAFDVRQTGSGVMAEVRGTF